MPRQSRKSEEKIDTESKGGFEESLENLEKIIEQLEGDELTLDKALTYFEEGIGYMRQCDGHLKTAQGKIKELLQGENGEFIEKILGNSLDSFVNRIDEDE